MVPTDARLHSITVEDVAPPSLLLLSFIHFIFPNQPPLIFPFQPFFNPGFKELGMLSLLISAFRPECRFGVFPPFFLNRLIFPSLPLCHSVDFVSI